MLTLHVHVKKFELFILNFESLTDGILTKCFEQCC